MFKAKVVLLVSFFTLTYGDRMCREPVDAAEQIGAAFHDIYTNRYLGNFTFFEIPNFRQTMESHWQFKAHNDIGSGNRYYCNNLHSGTSNIDLLPDVNLGVFERTECRYSYVMTYDADRIPNYIAEAVCKCDKCRRGRCRKVFSYTPIVVKMCNVLTGEYMYQGQIRETPVACMCVLNQRSGRIASFQ